MAMWYEIAIPATTTLIGTLGGGLLGARWQRRNSIDLLRLQFAENSSAREAQFKHDERMRVLERRQSVFAEFRTLIFDRAQMDHDEPPIAVLAKAYGVPGDEAADT